MVRKFSFFLIKIELVSACIITHLNSELGFLVNRLSFSSVLLSLYERIIVSLEIVSVLILAVILESKIKFLVSSGILKGSNSRIIGALALTFWVLDA